jgi:hypothetical protein
MTRFEPANHAFERLRKHCPAWDARLQRRGLADSSATKSRQEGE